MTALFAHEYAEPIDVIPDPSTGVAYAKIGTMDVVQLPWLKPGETMISTVTPGYVMVQNIEAFRRKIEWENTLAEARREAVAIVQCGLSDVRAWVGEIAPQDVACLCAGREELYGWLGHRVRDHDHDCDTSPPCGGCMTCIVDNAAFYASFL